MDSELEREEDETSDLDSEDLDLELVPGKRKLASSNVRSDGTIQCIV